MVSVANDGEDVWGSWCITEAPVQPRQRARPPPLPDTAGARIPEAGRGSRPVSGRSANCTKRKEASECSTRASTPCGESRPSSSSRSSSVGSPRSSVGTSQPPKCSSSVGSPRSSVGTSQPPKWPKWQNRWVQEALSAHLSVPRRQRLVQSTLQAARGTFDPAQGLEAAAAAEAAEFILRAPREQQARCASLATPREVKSYAPECTPMPAEAAQVDFERLEALSRPRELKMPEQATPRQGPVLAPSALAQRFRCEELAKHREVKSMDGLDIEQILAEQPIGERIPLHTPTADTCRVHLPPLTAREAGRGAHLRSSSEPPYFV